MQPRGSTPLRLGLAAAATYFIAHFLGWDALALLMKPTPVLCLLAFLLPVRNRDAALIAGGLLLSAIGDLLLSTALAGLYGYRGHVPWDISIQTMLYLHASVNALGFVGLGLWGWQARTR